MVKYWKYHFLIIIFFQADIVLAQESISAEFSDFNKTVFFDEEVIVLCAEVFNNTADNIAVCHNSKIELFSTTYNKRAEEFDNIAPSGPYPIFRGNNNFDCGPGMGNRNVEPETNSPCDFDGYGYGHSMVEKKSRYYLTYVLNEYRGNLYSQGNFSWYPLPCGEYIFTVTFYFTAGEKIKKDFKFRIEPTPAEKIDLNKKLWKSYLRFSDIYLRYIRSGSKGYGYPENDYNPSDPNSIHYFFEHCEDADFRDKAFYYVAIKEGLLRESELEKISKVTNKALLINVLYQFAEDLSVVEDNTEKQNFDVIPVYNKILKKLKDKDPAISEAFINKIKSQNALADKQTGLLRKKTLRKIPDQQVNRLTNYALRKKK